MGKKSMPCFNILNTLILGFFLQNQNYIYIYIIKINPYNNLLNAFINNLCMLSGSGLDRAIAIFAL